MGFLNPVNKSFCLQTLCEENYARLLRLVPNLPYLEAAASQCLFDNNTLYIIRVEKSPYTLHCELVVRDTKSKVVSSSIKCRLYLDTKSVDVLDIKHLTPVFSDTSILTPKQIMDNKWVLNYFLDKWLSFYLTTHTHKSSTQQVISA
ncbi:MAG: hypothetical protein A6F71_05415 [Cycloclasticus sp. symbiont of Poecilosclerida sp. M]|nr:MAG: hypothetical protein A6F71_05415 [Cycloclasticus sp. symbiont of Poecilosclerida sp. M]